MSTNILNEISDVLNDIERYWTNEKLAKQLIIEDLRNNDIKLISILLSNQAINETYVQDIDGYKIFDKESFISMLRYKNYWQDSYTKYSNKIGLTVEGKYLNYNSDVVLDFPFKDCVLEGGMTKEDSVLKNDEKFYNQVIAKEEIDTLLLPKAFTNIKKYDDKGEKQVNSLDANDNLIIKGNNLIALHSLKKRYTNKVNLVYIDPPYNTGNDTFQYNDRFNHASWLTFMKNRLEIAYNLLNDNGVICLNIDDDEAHYLKILLDEIFGRENFVSNVIWQKKFSPQNDATYFSDMHDHILIYSKNKKQLNINLLPRTADMDKRYKNPDNDPRGVWASSDLTVKTYSEEYDYPITTPSGKVINPPKSRCWRTSKGSFEKLKEENRIWFGENGDNVPRLKRFLTDVKQGMTPTTIWLHNEVAHNQEARKEITNLIENDDFATPKPEKLLKRIIHLFTNADDLILDFFMGSATTQAVAHKMNRQYIGIEQMDYINSVSVLRLQKVIEGEQGGISKDVDWQGGGSFVYGELAKENQEIVDRIISSSTKEELSQQIDKLLNDGVLNYEVDFDKFTSTKKEFYELELEDQKEVLIRVLDNNQLYVNYSDIEDSAYNFTEDEIAFNHSFYGGE
ncbi:site-specific DNA-methyltransferase [Staphylococcus saprophyticus]|uniref:Type III restriction endonuclease subunit M n=5 Tax=Staphylococcus TaxID=1279 RepID=A0AAP7IC80_9STAP|nr:MULTISPECIES: site-specific DNA-methyltransferase [Staphylococcaceae]MDK9863437.1 site-specific DNA-methyltransferase [Staphylococcus equorum]MDT3985658.1 site-specific DNA-methyltransferase [Staphylococcus saprophyticus]MDW3929312.1 site-specific DNA-methyltransferase [Staphylococcus saprophyticus]MDW4038793.1 site-specific DNA-methyltransferase [Staphylococcus saprophyticus]MDW4289188.1 site-specific DNA-methyltransferase [Staphylococcus saprophyticus]